MGAGYKRDSELGPALNPAETQRQEQVSQRLSERQAYDAAREVAGADEVPQNAPEGLTELSEEEEEVSTKYLESISFETDQLLQRRYK